MKRGQSVNKPLFSIIIAVYNIEDYLQKCLDSIDKQVNNYEVVIIDDGSTDSSGTICDKWASKKNYVKVFHQSNQGISATRNNGIQYSKGEYIVFVDPDDWIEDDFTKTLQELVEANGTVKKVDVIAYNFALVSNLSGTFNYVESGDAYPKHLVSGEEVVNWILDTKVGNYACQYAIKRNIYIEHSIRFPKMVLYEDAATIFRLIFFSKSVICTNRVLYNYFQRDESFSHKATLSRTTEYFNLFEQMDNFFHEHNRPDLIARSKEYKLMRLLSAYLNIIRLNMSKREKKKYYKKIRHAITVNFVIEPHRKMTLIKELLFYMHLFKPMAYIHDWRISR